MEGLTLSAKEQNRLQVLNGVLEQRWSMREAAPLLGVSERQGWRLLAAYRKEGARGLAHKNRGRIPPNATPKNIQQQVVALAVDRYERINHTHLSELLAEREGLMLSRPTVRRILVRAGLSSPRHRRPPQHRSRRQRMPQEGMLLLEAFSDNGTLSRGEKREGGGVLGLLVQGIDLPHLERSHNCPKTTPVKPN